MKNSSDIKYLFIVLYIFFLTGLITGQTYYKVYDCTVSSSKTDSTKNDSISGKINTIKHITEIGFNDTISIMLKTKKGISKFINFKDIKQIMVFSKNNAGKTAGYGAIIGFAALSIPFGLLALSDNESSAGLKFLAVGAAGFFGAIIGTLTGLFIGSAGNEPDILDLTMPLTNTEKRGCIVKFLNRLNN
jgi:hypothetical protein